MWHLSRCLYAYLSPDGREILYIGKAWGTTVKARWSRSAKENFWTDLQKERKIGSHIALIGLVCMIGDQRLTSQLLSDVESLLINREKPWGNIQSRCARISRPGMQVKCSGKWPGVRSYVDG
jgi:hypothetical protein